MKQNNIFTKLILLFTLIPLAELYVLFKVAKITSWLFTILLVIITGVLGAYLAKQEGRQIIYRIQNEINNGKMPGKELVNGLCVLIGGALLLTPGIITDVIGFSLIIPITRIIYRNWIIKILNNAINRGSVNVFYTDIND